MFVRDYMTPNPVMVDTDMTFLEATSLMRKRKIRRLPVVDHDQLVGIVSEEDLLSNQPSPATTLSIHEMYALLERLRVRHDDGAEVQRSAKVQRSPSRGIARWKKPLALW
jgi:acetoin utilization protein AcuB